MSTNEALASLFLPPAVRVQMRKLLTRIRLAANRDDLWCASDRASEFVHELEKLAALEAAGIKGFYEAFDEAVKARMQEEPL